MSRTEGPDGDYTLHVDGRGAVVSVRGPATVELFRACMGELTAHPEFRLDLPSVWDLSESEGFGAMARADLARLMMISREARTNSPGYRVALVAGRDVDFGVGRMLEGTLDWPEGMEYAVFRELEGAKAWAFGSHDA